MLNGKMFHLPVIQEIMAYFYLLNALGKMFLC